MKKLIAIVALIGCSTFLQGRLIPSLAVEEIASSAKAPTMESCEQTCRSCLKVCQDTLAYCEKKGGKHTDLEHLNTLKDCIATCTMSVDFLSRGSHNHGKSCAFCAQICELCAVSCESFKNDQTMKSCAAECRKCADSCNNMSKRMTSSRF